MHRVYEQNLTTLPKYAPTVLTQRVHVFCRGVHSDASKIRVRWPEPSVLLTRGSTWLEAQTWNHVQTVNQ